MLLLLQWMNEWRPRWGLPGNPDPNGVRVSIVGGEECSKKVWRGQLDYRRGRTQMDWSSWFRKALLKDSSKAAAATSSADPTKAEDPPPPSKKQPRLKLSDLEEYGITDKLVDFVTTFTVDTFKSFPLQDDGDEPGRDIESGATAEGNHERDLSRWQERHATLALGRVKELAHLRYVLCPRQMKELRFWQIYFMLVRSHVAEYELRAIKLARLNEMKNEGGKTSEGNGFEVEMSESMPSTAQEPTP